MKRKLLIGALLAALPAATLAAGEKQSFERLFRMADINGDGKLSQSEFGGLRTRDKEEKPERHFKTLDRNGDRRLTLEEFKSSKKSKSTFVEESRANRER